MKKNLYQEWNRILLLEKSSPYAFRAKLERTINHTIKYANIEKESLLMDTCKSILFKLQYISDQSNQTSDGCLNSFIILKSDMLNVRDMLSV